MTKDIRVDAKELDHQIRNPETHGLGLSAGFDRQTLDRSLAGGLILPETLYKRNGIAAGRVDEGTAGDERTHG